MKLGVPSMGNRGLDEAVGEHFGRVPAYTVVDTETNEVRTLGNTSDHMGGVGNPPEILKAAGANIMLCSSLGRRAIQMFEEFGIEVFIGVSGTVGDAIQAWKNGQLQEATDKNACAQHAFRGERHGKDGCDNQHDDT